MPEPGRGPAVAELAAAARPSESRNLRRARSRPARAGRPGGRLRSLLSWKAGPGASGWVAARLLGDPARPFGRGRSGAWGAGRRFCSGARGAGRRFCSGARGTGHRFCSGARGAGRRFCSGARGAGQILLGGAGSGAQVCTPVRPCPPWPPRAVSARASNRCPQQTSTGHSQQIFLDQEDLLAAGRSSPPPCIGLRRSCAARLSVTADWQPGARAAAWGRAGKSLGP